MDRQDFLKTLAEACQKTGFQVHAYCLTRHQSVLVTPPAARRSPHPMPRHPRTEDQVNPVRPKPVVPAEVLAPIAPARRVADGSPAG